MAYISKGSGLEQYQKVGVQSEIEAASPHRLIQMLMDGALAKITTAKLCLSSGQVAGKGESISMAISIIGGLRASLDKDQGGEIASNLDSLYDYMERRLLEANIKNDASMLDEVVGLINEVKSAWDAISPDAAEQQQVV